MTQKETPCEQAGESIDQLQDHVLQQLDDLNERILGLLNDFSGRGSSQHDDQEAHVPEKGARPAA